MYEIVKREEFAPNTYLLEIHAPLIAKSIKPGEFVIIMVDDMSERIPMAVYDINGENIIILYDVRGYSTNELKNTDHIFSVLGPLGNESKLTLNIDDYRDKKVCFFVSGTGLASVNRIAKTLTNSNIINDIYFINKGLNDSYAVINEDEVDETINKYDVVLTCGNYDFMENIVNKSKVFNKEIYVSLAPLMLDGVGLCGVCRVLIDGKPKFACMDGPEFDGLRVDFDSAKKRINLFKTEEGRRYLRETEGDTHMPGGEV